MTRERLPNTSSIPLRGRRGARSAPLLDVRIYRPGPALALSVLLLPVVVALSGAAVYVGLDGAVPPWLPFTLLLWAPCLPALWFTMQSVRTSTAGIGVGRPWQQWEEMAWEAVERVERRGPFLRIVSSQGQAIMFAPMLLREGGRLRRQLLLRLPAHVLTGRLAAAAQRLLVTDIQSTAEGGYSGVLTTRVRARWRVAIVVLGAALGALGALGVLAVKTQSAAVAVALAASAALIDLLLVFALAWSSQSVLIDEGGMSIVSPILRRRRSLAWDEIELIEHTPRQTVLRVRGRRRLVCAGPGLLTAAHATLMRGMLYEYGAKRGVPILRRMWVF
jgi:hypothetical protein